MNSYRYILVIHIIAAVQASTTSSIIKVSLTRRERFGQGDEDLKYAVVPLTEVDHCFYGQITVGTAGAAEEQDQVFTVLFDTGSKHLWLASEDAHSQEFKAFDGSKSSTYEKIEEKRFKVKYTGGTSIEGHLAKDTIKVGSGDHVIVVEDQIFGEADNITGTFANFDGVFGLGLVSWSVLPDSPDPPFWSMIQQVNMMPVFGIYLNRNYDGSHTGELVFGGHDEDKIEGEFTVHPVVKVDDIYKGWIINFDKIKVDKMCDSPAEFVPEKEILALPDSGCNIINGPEELIFKVNTAIFSQATFRHSPKFAFRCDTNWKDLPDVIFTMGGHDFVLTPQDYVWRLEEFGNICRSALFGHKLQQVVLGQPFMSKYYTRFDMLHQQVQFAKARHETDLPVVT